MDEHGRRLQLIAETLDVADSHGLQVEVVWSALTIAAEANEHDMSFDQVLEAALGEWDIQKGINYGNIFNYLFNCSHDVTNYTDSVDSYDCYQHSRCDFQEKVA